MDLTDTCAFVPKRSILPDRTMLVAGNVLLFRLFGFPCPHYAPHVIEGRNEVLLKRRRVAVSLRTVPVGGAVASAAAEPKWKQKLAAADELAEKTRQADAQAQEEYRRRQAGSQSQQHSTGNNIVNLASLKFIPILTEEGKIVDCSREDSKASVYAIFDEAQRLQYIGVTRAIYPSLKLHFARVPSKCFYVKVEHLTRPSRSLLERIRNKWIADIGFTPAGNDNGQEQNIWENPLDCKPLMTDEEKTTVEEATPGPPKARALKIVARRIEADLQEIYKERKCSEKMWFDPKLKDKGLLELKNSDPKPKRVPDSDVPVTDINPTASTASPLQKLA